VSSLWKAGGDLMLAILNFFYSMTHSYGLAIILLTVAVRLALHPLSHKQLLSMQRMQKIQPRLKVLQEKYGDDKAKLNEEMMRLYKENGVNPAAGCLPLLLQLPIFILLYQSLFKYNFKDVYFFGVSLDKSALSTVAAALGLPGNSGLLGVLTGLLTAPAGLANVGLYGANVVLLVLVGFLTWFQQKLSAGNNPQMAFMNWFMPLFMTFICLTLPGGVMLYWGASSLISVAQQKWVLAKAEQEMKVKPVLHEKRPDREEDVR